MFHMVLASKKKSQDRSLKLVRSTLRASPGRPIVVMRTSRRDGLFELFKNQKPSNPHLILYKGSSAFLERLNEETRGAYRAVQVPGEGFFDAEDAAALSEELADAVVVFDVVNGNLAGYQNLVRFARSLNPRQIVALVGDRFEVLPAKKVESPEEKLSLASPEMEPVYLGIDVDPLELVRIEEAPVGVGR